MASWWESVKNAVGTAYCNVSDWSVWYATEVAALLDETKLDELGEAQRDLFKYWNSVACGKSPDALPPPVFDAPFTGGQCTNRQYRMRFRAKCPRKVDGLVTPFTITYIALGALRSPFYQYESDTNVWAFYGRNSTGQQRISSVPASVYDEPTLEIIDICLVSGGTFICDQTAISECGDPPSGAEPTGQPFTETRDVTYTDEFGVEQTATAVQFTYGLPFVEPDGTISVPYEVCYDEFCFKGKTNFGDELVVRPEAPSKPLLPPLQTVGEPTGTGTEIPDPELDGEPLPESEKEKKPILGVFVKSQKTGNKRRATEISLDDYAPAILAPNIGFVRYRVFVGDESGWLSDIPIKNVNAYIPVPDKLEAVEVRIEWQSGWKGKYLINRGKHCCQECEDSD